MNTPLYIVERWPLGWLICSVPPHKGVPVDALTDCLPMFPSEAVMDAGIPHHLNRSGYDKQICLCVGNNAELNKWRQEIEKSMDGWDPEERWWKGTDVGRSSAAIFSALAISFRLDVSEYAQGATPQDAADLGRCLRLLARFPAWRERLNEVADANQKTRWPEIVARWTELEKATPKEQNETLRKIHTATQ